jgi:hypothetical protein
MMAGSRPRPGRLAIRYRPASSRHASSQFLIIRHYTHSIPQAVNSISAAGGGARDLFLEEGLDYARRLMRQAFWTELPQPQLTGRHQPSRCSVPESRDAILTREGEDALQQMFLTAVPERRRPVPQKRGCRPPRQDSHRPDRRDIDQLLKPPTPSISGPQATHP